MRSLLSLKDSVQPSCGLALILGKHISAYLCCFLFVLKLRATLKHRPAILGVYKQEIQELLHRYYHPDRKPSHAWISCILFFRVFCLCFVWKGTICTVLWPSPILALLVWRARGQLYTIKIQCETYKDTLAWQCILLVNSSVVPQQQGNVVPSYTFLGV